MPPAKDIAVAEHTFTGPPRDGHGGHTTYYLASGPERGTPVIMVHGWPERAVSWRHVMPVLAGLGFRCYAPDMRGYGRSSVYAGQEDYRMELVVKDLLELADHVGARKAVWIGHDFGSPAVGALVQHHPERVHGAVFLCVPYYAKGFIPQNFLPFVDRSMYPENKFPWGQWDYIKFYQIDSGSSERLFDKDVERTFKILFRAGDPTAKGKRSGTATICNDGGWFGGASEVPNVPIDKRVITEDDLKVYVDGMRKNGFFGANSWYRNFDHCGEYAAKAPNNGTLEFPVMFIHARYDWACEAIESHLADPMRESCKDLTEFVVDAGHWVAQEKPAQTAAAIAQWLARKLPTVWNRDGLEEITRSKL
ncbi:Alpha/Beta hydrolase protein [Hyaloraphidium curvatum]|nr:Alpha/Beta hydrolase protein [Hyaloraphidium curvatum]